MDHETSSILFTVSECRMLTCFPYQVVMPYMPYPNRFHHVCRNSRTFVYPATPCAASASIHHHALHTHPSSTMRPTCQQYCPQYYHTVHAVLAGWAACFLHVGQALSYLIRHAAHAGNALLQEKYFAACHSSLFSTACCHNCKH